MIYAGTIYEGRGHKLKIMSWRGSCNENIKLHGVFMFRASQYISYESATGMVEKTVFF